VIFVCRAKGGHRSSRCLRARYLSSGRSAHYSAHLLRDADRVPEAKLYSYNRRSASLLEMLDGQRANNDVYLAYYAAMSEQAKATCLRAISGDLGHQILISAKHRLRFLGHTLVHKV
jgi:hypothetical protein